MTTVDKEPVRILAHLITGQKASRDMTGGILHFAAVHPEVQVQLYGIGALRHTKEEFRTWEPDGVIIGTNDPRTVRTLPNIGCKAAVFVNVEPPPDTELRCGSVFCDNKAIAEAAAKLFIDKHLTSLAYVNTREMDMWAMERGRAMRDFACLSGCSFSEFDTPRTARRNQRQELTALAEWISTIPKPCGIFAANDARAKDVLDACKKASIAIPEQAMVLGVDNEDFLCSQIQPTLSSIIPDFAHGGYIAAEMLVQLVYGKERTLPPRTFGVQGIIERISTCDPNGAGRMVSKANEFMRLYAGNRSISVSDVAKAAGASLRLLQMNYKAVTGRTICDTLQSIRLQKVCELLEQTMTPIGTIGELCGFNNEMYLKKLFRSKFGCPMRNWRNKQKPR